MPDLCELADELKHQRRNVDSFVKAVVGWGEGQQMQFRVDPRTAQYGSNHPWHNMDRPEFHPNFEYRLADRSD